MAITMQMMKTTASTGPITQMSPSSPSTMGCGSGLSSWKGSEKGLAANVCRNRAGGASVSGPAGYGGQRGLPTHTCVPPLPKPSCGARISALPILPLASATLKSFCSSRAALPGLCACKSWRRLVLVELLHGRQSPRSQVPSSKKLSPLGKDPQPQVLPSAQPRSREAGRVCVWF